jgi:N6-L-threonylcarbamoyladenine synthase
VAKLLGLGYPGGPIIDRLAKHGDPAAVKFGLVQIKHRDRNEASRLKAQGASEKSVEFPRYDFSYSGIKTAVLRYTETHHMAETVEARRRALLIIPRPALDDYLRLCDRVTLDLVASFQRAMVEDLVGKTLTAARDHEIATLLVTGGVAANSELRETFERESSAAGIKVYFPSRPLSTDNAAMIAAAAYSRWLTRDFADQQLSAEASLPLR